MIVISKYFAESEFQSFESNFDFVAVNEPIMELLLAWLQH